MRWESGRRGSHDRRGGVNVVTGHHRTLAGQQRRPWRARRWGLGGQVVGGQIWWWGARFTGSRAESTLTPPARGSRRSVLLAVRSDEGPAKAVSPRRRLPRTAAGLPGPTREEGGEGREAMALREPPRSPCGSDAGVGGGKLKTSFVLSVANTNTSAGLASNARIGTTARATSSELFTVP